MLVRFGLVLVVRVEVWWERLKAALLCVKQGEGGRVRSDVVCEVGLWRDHCSGRFFPCVRVSVFGLSVLVRRAFGECAQEESYFRLAFLVSTSPRLFSSGCVATLQHETRFEDPREGLTVNFFRDGYTAVKSQGCTGRFLWSVFFSFKNPES